MKKLEHLLYQDESVKRIFIPPPMVSYRRARKLSNYLVRAKLYPLEKKRYCYKCDNLKCLVCNSIEETDTFTSTVACKSFKINHHLCCNDKCHVYLLTFKVCKKRYTGKTVDRFRLQQNNYKESDRKSLRGEELKQKSFYEFFLSDGHFILFYFIFNNDIQMHM